jgi:hypothetical protein
VIGLGALAFGCLCFGGVLTAVLLPAVQKTREAAMRAQTMNNMKEIALACISHADRNRGHLPSPKLQPNPHAQAVELSWRVTVLPFLMSPDAAAAANRFDLTAAWDSPRNQPVANPMPGVYVDPVRDPVVPSVGTVFQVFTGPKTLWPNNGARLYPAHIPDGTSNTILFAEAARSVAWTKPADMVIQPDQPLPLPPDRFLAAMADGSVRLINRRRTSDATLRLAIDPADGNPLPADWD